MSSFPNSSSSSEAPLAPGSLGSLQAVACAVDVVLGSSAMTVRELLRLKRNTIVRLRESAGADMQVLVNGIAVARGEVVIVDDSTAVRVTDILPPANGDGE